MSFPIPVAPFLHTITPLRLGVLEAGPHTGNAVAGETDGFRVRLRPLSGAYVCLVPASFDEMLAADAVPIFDATSLLTGRTDGAGHLVLSPNWHATPATVGIRELEHPLCSWACDPPVHPAVAKVGASWMNPDSVRRARESEPGRLFWTYHADAFQEFLDALWLPANPDGSEPTEAERRASFEAAVSLHWLFLFGDLARPTLPLLDLPALGEDERLRVQELLLVPAGRTQQHLTFGHVNDERFTARDRMGYPHAGVIFDATPPPLRALYTAEWIARCVVHLRKEGAEDWATLHRAGEVARAYSGDKSVREQEQALSRSFAVPEHGGIASAHAPGFEGATTPTLHDEAETTIWVKALRGFALNCARAGTRRDQVANTLEDLARHVHEAILGPPSAAPALRELAVALGPRLAAHAQLSEATRGATLDYFDVYAYGKVLLEAGLQAECDAHAHGIDEAVRWVSQKADRLVQTGLRYDDFALALWTRVRDDDARERLHSRFEAVHWAFQVPFWGASISLERWDALRPALRWMRSAISRTASVWNALIKEEVHAYASLVQDADAANQMLNFLYRHHRSRMGEALHGTAEATHTVWKGVVRHRQDFRIDFGAGRVDVLTEHGATSPPVRFVHSLRSPGPTATLRMSTVRSNRLRHAVLHNDHLNPVRDNISDFAVTVPADTRRWDANAPAYLKALANALNMGLILTALNTETQRLDVYTCIDLSQGALASVDSVGSVLYALNRHPGALTPLATLHGGVRGVERANHLYNWAAQAGRAAGVVSVLADLMGGLKVFMVTGSSRERILHGDAEGDVADAARRGDSTLYDLYVAQGTLKLLAGTGGAVMLAAGISSGPLAIGVLACGVLVLLCDGAIAVHHAGQPAVTAFISRVYQARERELQHVARGDADVDGESELSLTARRIATLNARLRDALEA